MSVRSFRRAHARRLDRERRRAATLRRRGARVAGATLSATALFAASAQAATLVVTGNGDDAPGGTCPSDSCTTLRDAISQANSDSSADTITFAAGVTSPITLTNGALNVTDADGLTITGPGAAKLSVSAGGASQLLTDSTTNSTVSISGLTLTDGHGTSGGALEFNGQDASLSLTGVTVSDSTASESGGGILHTGGGTLTLTNATVTGNTATDSEGGGIFDPDKSDSTTITDSTVSDNHAYSGGGVYAENLDISGASQITDNQATADGAGIHSSGGLTINDATISGNTSAGLGGGVWVNAKYGAVTISDATISGNTAAGGGGVVIDAPGTAKYQASDAPVSVTGTTVSGNTAPQGAGVEVIEISHDSPTAIEASTISGNQGGSSSFGGGLLLLSKIDAPFTVLDSTISGNTATTGGGVSLGNAANPNNNLIYDNAPNDGSISFENSTIAANAATAAGGGGGIYMDDYTGGGSNELNATAAITSTIVSGNTAAGTAQDLARANGSTSTTAFTGAFSLIQAPGSVPLAEQAVITGASSQLGQLANNGGPTETMLPAITSPVIDQGKAASGLTTDQRGDARTVDITSIANVSGGDATDIGAVELPASAFVKPPPPPPPTSGFSARIGGATLGSGSPLLVGRSTPVTCAVRAGTLSACTISVRAGNGTVLATGHATSAGGTSVSLHVTATAAGLKALKRKPLGVTASASIAGITSISGQQTSTGQVHLLAGPSITLSLGKRSAKLSKNVLRQLDQGAKLLAGASSIKVTAYAGKGKGKKAESVAALTRAESEAARKALGKDGFHGKLSSAGTRKPSSNKLTLTFKL